MKKYAEGSKAKKYRKIKGGCQKLNFGASKPGVGGARAPLDLLVVTSYIFRMNDD